MTEVFMYNITGEKALKIKNLCRKLYIGTREIDRADYGVRIETLLGLSDDRSEQPDADFDDEMLYLVDFNGPLLNTFLNRLRAVKAPVALKAMMTETNVGFTAAELVRELKAEHEALNADK